MLIFWFKEALKIFARAKSSSILSLLTLTISILLISASLYSVYLSNRIEKKIKEQYIINIFLKDAVSDEFVNQLKDDIQDKPYVLELKYINKEKAAENFIKETGEDFRKILDYNPIPASFSVRLKSEYVNKESLIIIKKQFKSFFGVDEIAIEHELLDRIINVLKEVQKYVFILTGILILISVYITYSTIKLVISLKADELETMKLVGAKLSTIKIPIILNELLTGFLAGIFAVGVIMLISMLLINYTPSLNSYTPRYEFLLLSIFIGPIISLTVSLVVLRKVTLKI